VTTFTKLLFINLDIKAANIMNCTLVPTNQQ